MNNKIKFQKISALSESDRKKVKDYWTDQWGSEYADALVTDFENTGSKKEVKANTENKIEKINL